MSHHPVAIRKTSYIPSQPKEWFKNKYQTEHGFELHWKKNILRTLLLIFFPKSNSFSGQVLWGVSCDENDERIIFRHFLLTSIPTFDTLFFRSDVSCYFLWIQWLIVAEAFFIADDAFTHDKYVCDCQVYRFSFFARLTNTLE